MTVNRGWLVVAACFLSTGFTIGSAQYAFGVFVDPLEGQFGWTRTQINIALSFAALSGLFTPIAGRIMDKFGARPVMVVSLLIMSVSFGLRPFMDGLWQWYILSALQYTGFVGASVLPAGRLVGIWFQRTRGRMMGLVTMGNNFGGLTMTPLAGLIVGTINWQAGFLSFGVLALGISFLVFFIVREGPDEAEQSSNCSLGEGRTRLSSRDGPPPALTGATTHLALHSKTFYYVAASVFMATFTYSAVLPQIIPHFTNAGMSLAQASALLTQMAAFGMGGKLIFGLLSERITARYSFALSLGGQMLGLFLIIVSGTNNSVWLAMPIFGVAFGGLGALMPLLVQELFGLKAFGSIFGMVNLATVGSFLGGPIMVGLIVDFTGTYPPAFFAVVGMFAIGIILVFLARPLPKWD